MIKKIKAFLFKIVQLFRENIKFSPHFVSPLVHDTSPYKKRLEEVVNERVDKANKQQKEEQDKYTAIMHEHLKVFFGRKYNSTIEEQMAFDSINKEWKLLARKVNKTNKLVQLNKKEFEIQVELHFKKILEKQIVHKR